MLSSPSLAAFAASNTPLGRVTSSVGLAQLGQAAPPSGTWHAPVSTTTTPATVWPSTPVLPLGTSLHAPGPLPRGSLVDLAV